MLGLVVELMHPDFLLADIFQPRTPCLDMPMSFGGEDSDYWCSSNLSRNVEG
jgi:hypothetical protein